MWPRHRPEPAPDVAAALASLDRLAAERPELAAPADALARVLAAAFDRPRPATYDVSLDLTPPFFRNHPPGFDAADLRRRAGAVARALEPDNDAARPLRAALDAGLIDPAAHLIAGLTNSDPAPLPADVDIGLVDSVACLVALPALAPVAARLADRRSPFADRRFACALCDSSPLLAEARGLEQHRVLRCGFCAAAWPMPRLDCPACSGRALQVHHVEGDADRYRLLMCSGCGLRLKLVTTLGPLSPPALLVADLASVHLDLIAGPGDMESSRP